MDDQTKNLIQNHIDTNDVSLFMKGTPDAPQCGFSMAVSNMLKILEVNFKEVTKILNKNSVHHDELGVIIEKDMIINEKTKVTIDELKTYNTNWLTNYMSS